MVGQESNILQEIWATKNFEVSNGRFICTTRANAVLDQFINVENAISINPSLAICDLGFQTRPISVLKGRDVNICKNYFQDLAFQHLQSLGGVIIHEYSHFLSLTNRYLNRQKTEDYIYSCRGAQNLKRRESMYSKLNAESYYSLAAEFYWTMQCGKKVAPLLDDMSSEEYLAQRRLGNRPPQERRQGDRQP